MLLYIGNQEEYHCLQELSDKLKQPICIIPAPENPREILASAKAQYSYYIVNIGSYEDRQKELIVVLKELLGSIEGKLILLAVNMTTETPMIMELMYAGFTNIIFGKTTPDLSFVPVKQGIVNATSERTEFGDTEPFFCNGPAMGQRPTESMRGEYISCEPKLSDNNSCTISENRRSSIKDLINKRFIVGGACILVFLIALVVVYQLLVAKQGNGLNNTEEVVSLEEGQKTEKYIAPAITAMMKGMSDYLHIEQPAVSKPQESTLPDLEGGLSKQEVLVEPKAVEPKKVEPKEAEQLKEPEEFNKPEVLAKAEVQGKSLDENEVSGKETKKAGREAKKASRNTKKATTVEKDESASVAIQSISLPLSIRMVTGKSATLLPKCKPANSKRISLHWHSNNTQIATVKNGTIKAIRQGVVFITVKTKSGKSAECKVVIADQ